MYYPTKEMKSFLMEFADLLEKHEVVIDSDGPSMYCYMESKYDYTKDKPVRDFCEVELPEGMHTYDIRELGEK
jgi:hypothetical protein